MKKQDFVQLVAEDVKKHRVTLYMPNSKRVKSDNVLVTGTFDDKARQLKVATQNPMWFEVFVHEYGHFRQWVENCSCWTTYNKYSRSCERLFFAEMKMGPEALHNGYKATRDLELDCEKRTARMIIKHQLPVDVKRYVKRANAYIFFYAYLKKHRKWYGANQPYRIKKIVDLMPSRFLTPKQYETMPSGYEELVAQYCIS